MQGFYNYDDCTEFGNLSNLIIQWAKDRNLIEGSSPKEQFHKLIQECAELSESLCKDKDPHDDFGDILVVLIIMAYQKGINLVDCLAIAYDEIKDRKGQMINGVFVKEE